MLDWQLCQICYPLEIKLLLLLLLFTMQCKSVMLYFSSQLGLVLDPNFAVTHIYKQRQFVEK